MSSSEYNPDDAPRRSTREKRKPARQLKENLPENVVKKTKNMSSSSQYNFYNPDPPKRSTREKREPVTQQIENLRKYAKKKDEPRKERRRPNKTKAKTEDSDSENSDVGDHGRLSAYELERLENIRQNKVFLSSINLLQATEDLKQSTRPKPSQKRNLTSRSKIAEKDELPPRKSLRLQQKAPDGVTLPPEPRAALSTYSDWPRPKNPPGPLSMDPVNMEEGSRLPPELLQLCSEVSTNEEKVDLDLKQYRSAVKNMKIPENGVAKVVKDRIFSAAFHPCTSSLLMAAGDKLGQVGLWNFGAGWGDRGVLLFEPHTRPVSCMAFSRANPAHLLSLSYDGSLRCMDIEKAIFDDVYDIEDGLKTFDFLSDDCSTLVVGDWHGDVAIVDRRTQGTSHESVHTLDPKGIRCVNVHPLNKQYFVVAENKMVSVYDIRSLNKTNSKPVCQLHGHKLTISSAYFSPTTGNKVLTSCLDNRIRIYDTSDLISKAPLVTNIGYNMQTGRWLSKLAAVWDPKQEDCFVVGSMDRPRRVQVYHESGQILHSFRDDDHLTTVLSVTAFHPSRNALLGGNASGRLHVFTH